ncbi:hypothetical protein [Faecalicatena contorta]|uniref:Uncharacterized protein n=1 Tax=Faecalicatena contorta TaxID=39482 RepID=A0A315ZZT1_9FIRM|nr:hypothetical protein [Faecalicatena contorta]PWJ51015.1 hypothetical protein A8805_103314 [Faecalicatena contorta]SUQ13583.1 hypothetical protein SAMN05216529_103314 [Faecalicatena contorta]
METENYIIAFFNLDPQYYTRAIIGDIWNTAARKVYEETGIIIVGEVSDSYFVDPSNEVLNGRNIFTIKSIRIPHRMGTESEYWDAYKNVVIEVKNTLGNPRMGLITEKVTLDVFEQF